MDFVHSVILMGSWINAFDEWHGFVNSLGPMDLSTPQGPADLMHSAIIMHGLDWFV